MNTYRIVPYAAMLLRLALGAAWLSHAFLKLAAFSMPALAAFLNVEGMPTPMAWPVALLELAGGAMIVLGIHGRAASLALLPLLAAGLLAHTGNGWTAVVPGGGWLYPAILMMATLLHIRLGDGAAALRSPVGVDVGRRGGPVQWTGARLADRASGRGMRSGSPGRS